MALQRVAGKTAMTDRVADIIREAIFQGSLKPEEHLTEERVSVETGVSRGPVREAFVKLEAEGLVVREPYRGARVVGVSRQDLQELFTVREAMEVLAVKLATPNFTPEEVKRLRSLISAKETTGPEESGSQERLSEAFHGLIYERCCNRRLRSFLAQIEGNVPKSMWRLRPYRIQELIDEFRHIVDAIEAGDAEAAARWMARHVSRGAQSILDIFDQYHESGASSEEPDEHRFTLDSADAI